MGRRARRGAAPPRLCSGRRATRSANESRDRPRRHSRRYPLEARLTISGSSYRDFREQEHTRGRGEEGEAAGADWLESVRGYRIVERNHTNAAGEIDAIAWDGEVLCFVEIKARSHAHHGEAIEAVGPAKQRRLIRVARLYLVRYDDEPPACRFDVLGMDQVDGAWRYTLIQDAFQAGG